MADSVLTAEILEPYAQALLSLAQSQNLLDQVEQDVNSVLDVLKESEDLNRFLASPLFNVEEKKTVLQQILGDSVHPYVRNFLLLLVDRRRIVFLEGILKQFQQLVRELNQAVLAEVTSAVDLNDDQKQAIREKVVALTGAQHVDLDVKLDSDLLGGVIIRVGSQVIDASLRGQLRRISLRLNSAA